jgi:bifunctional DNA-binding transcriptional regulator/antitoxin component of YhaV-PrlF toxin-antitoxin module
MEYTVSTEGQIVIDKSIREALGVDAGHIAVQRLVDDHVVRYSGGRSRGGADAVKSCAMRST